MTFVVDELARALARPVSRRRAFSILFGAAMATSVATLFGQGLGTGAACQNNAQCSSNNCSNCGNGTKACVPAGQACCNFNPFIVCDAHSTCCCPSLGICTSSTGTTCTGVSGCRQCGNGSC
jgi:hypothetical protein